MQLDNILLTNTIVGPLLSLLIGLIVIRAKSITLRNFQAVYLLLGSLNVALCYFIFPSVDILFPLIALAAGILLTFLAAGIFGKFDSSCHYETLLVGVGLFPWYLGWLPSVVYVAAALVFCAIVKLTVVISAINKIKYPLSVITKINTLPEDALKIYREKTSVILTTPVGFASIVAAFVFALQF